MPVSVALFSHENAGGEGLPWETGWQTEVEEAPASLDRQLEVVPAAGSLERWLDLSA